MSSPDSSTCVMNYSELMGSDQQSFDDFDGAAAGQSNRPCTYCLFLGDISLFCSEEDLVRAFSVFGEIADVRIKRNKVTKRNLSYGFVEYHNYKSAEAAVREMNGKVLCGRALKVSWSEPKETAEDESPKKTDAGQENPKSVSVYIAFNSTVPNLMINDESLRVVFARFGGLEDVSIKQSVLDRQTQCQRGYAFVCFEPNDQGMRAALNAASALADCHIDGVHYRCELSNTLRNKLSPTASVHGSPHASAQTPFVPAPMNNGFVPPPMVPMNNQMVPPPQFVPIARAPVPMPMPVPMQNMHMMPMPSPPHPAVQQGMNWSGQQVMPQMMGPMGQFQPQMVAPQNMGHQVSMQPQGPSHWQAQFRRESPSGSPGFPGHPSLSSHSSDTMSSGGMMKNQLPSPFAPNQPMVGMNPAQQMQAHGQAQSAFGFRVQPSHVPVYASPQQQMMPQGQPMPMQMHVFSAPPMQSMHQPQHMAQQPHYGGNYMSH